MIEIILYDEKYIFYVSNILYVNAYESAEKNYFIDIYFKEGLELNLEFVEDQRTLFNNTYENILNKLKEADNHD